MVCLARHAAPQQRLLQLLLLAAVGVLPWLARPALCGCASPAAVAYVGVVADLGPAGPLTVSVRLTNASTTRPLSLLVFYFNSSGSLAYSGPQNVTADSRADFLLPASKLPLVAGVTVRSGYDAPVSLPVYGVGGNGSDLLRSQEAVTFIRATEASPSPHDVDKANWLHSAFGSASCTGQPLLLSRGLLTNVDLSAVKLCRLGSSTELQYTAVGAQGTCPEIVISELALGAATGSSGRFVELYCEGCLNSNLSGYSIAFFDLVTNGSLFVIPLNRTTTTDGRGFFLIGSALPSTTATAQLPTAVSAESGLVAVYASNLNQSVTLNLSSATDRSGLVGAVAFSSSSDGQVQLQLSSFTRNLKLPVQSAAVSLGRSRSENMSLSYCSSSVPGVAARFLLSPPSPSEPNSCEGMPAAASRHILHINEFNADVPGDADLTEFVELTVNVTANTTLDNYYVVLYQGMTLKASKVFSLAQVAATPNKQFIVIGTVDVCKPCDVTMPGTTIHNGMGAIAIHYREEGNIPINWPATRDGLVDAYVYTVDRSSEYPALSNLLGLDRSHVVYEDDSAFTVGDESVGLCGDNVVSLMFLTPGSPNNCLDSPSALKPRSSSTTTVYINEWQPSANGKTSYVELVGLPGTPLNQLALKVALLNLTSGAVLRESRLLKLDQGAQLSPAGLYGMSSGLDLLTVDASVGGGSSSGGMAYRLMLATVLNKTDWSHSEPLLPIDSVDVMPLNGAANPQTGGRFVQLDLANGTLSASRCRLNASAPASAAANSPAFDPQPITPNATANSCPPPFSVLINEVLPPTSSSASSYVELLVQAPATASISLDGYVLVYWSGDSGTAVKSVSLAKTSSKPSVALERIVVLDGPDFALPSGARYVVALYYNYDFLYPAGQRQATAERLQDSAAYSIDFNQPPLSAVLIKTFRSLYPSPDKSFFAQGVVTIVSTTEPLSLSRCPGSKGSTVDAFEPMPLTKGAANPACPAVRGGKAITVQHCLQQQLRISELALNASGSSFVELLSPEPGLPLTGLSLVLMWSGGSGNWSSANYSLASWRPTDSSSSGGYYEVVRLAANETSPPPGSTVLCVVLLNASGSDSQSTGPSLPPSPLNFSFNGSALDSRVVDALAIYTGSGSASAAGGSGEWPLTPPYAPLSSVGGLLGTASFSRCYVGAAAAKVNVAFAASARATPGAANDCPLPPVLVQYVCSTGGQADGGGAGGRNLKLKLDASAAPTLPLERLRVIAYVAQQQLVQPFTSFDIPLNVTAMGKDGTLAVSTANGPRVNDTLLAVAVYFYPPEMSIALSPTAPAQKDQPLLVNALMLHYQPHDGPWQRLSEYLQIDANDVPLVPMPNSSTTVCIARCQASGVWRVRLVENVESQSCPLQSGESVLINEIDVDQPGLDQHEFIELKGPGGLDASDYMIVISIVTRTGSQNLDVPLQGKFSPTGFFVIGTNSTDDAIMPFPGGVQGLLSNEGGAIALYKRSGTQGTGLLDVVLYATSTDTAQNVGKLLLPSLPVTKQSEVLVEDPKLYGGIGTLSRCFCNTTQDLSCFTMSMRPTPGKDNFCIRKEQPLALKFCLNRTTADDLSGIKEGLALAIDSNCSCAFSSYQLSDMKTCDAGVQFDAYGTSPEHLATIGRSFAAVLSRGILSDKKKGLDRSISNNCSLDCVTVIAPPPAQGGSNSGIVAGIVVSVFVLIAAGVVVVYFIRKRRADRGFQMARFDGTFDDDDAFVGDNATGQVTFSNPFRGSSADRRQYAKL